LIPTKYFTLLLIDDDAIDRELFREALSSIAIKCTISEASGGDEAIKMLEALPALPSLIVLDLNMPLKDGRETLKELKARNEFKHIPVVIFSTSNSQFDVRLSYQAGASLFIEKPHDFERLVDMLHHLFSLSGKYVSFVSANVR
jgi:CheY-like chemotaxis protein